MDVKPLILAGFTLAWAGAALAQDADASACDTASGPVISEGLPGQGCARDTGVVVHRGPEVTPEPSEAAPAYRPRFHSPPEERGTGSRDAYGRSSRVLLYPYPVVRERRPRSNLTLVYRDDNVFLRIGGGGSSKVYPHYRNKPRGGDVVIRREPRPLAGVPRR